MEKSVVSMTGGRGAEAGHGEATDNKQGQDDALHDVSSMTTGRLLSMAERSSDSAIDIGVSTFRARQCAK
jgi:hypothetical protein